MKQEKGSEVMEQEKKSKMVKQERESETMEQKRKGEMIKQEGESEVMEQARKGEMMEQENGRAEEVVFDELEAERAAGVNTEHRRGCLVSIYIDTTGAYTGNVAKDIAGVYEEDEARDAAGVHTENEARDTAGVHEEDAAGAYGGKTGFGKNNRGMGTVEIILIIVVLVGLVIIFKSQITQIVNSLFGKITQQTGGI